jgi:integrase/recombinase XerD
MNELTQHRNLMLEKIAEIDDAYSFHARHFCNWVEENRRDLDIDTIKEYFAALNDSDYAASTICVKRQAIKKRIRQIMHDSSISQRVHMDRELADLNIGVTRAPKVNSIAVGADKILTRDELDALVFGARSERQRLFIRFLDATGCRVSEMLAIRRKDCKRDRDQVHIRIIGKGKKERKIRVPEGLHGEITQCFQAESDFLFCTSNGKRYTRTYVSDQIHKLGRQILNRDISAHTFRHTFATRMIRRTGKIKAVSEYLGHASVAVTLEMYCHESLDDSELFEAL